MQLSYELEEIDGRGLETNVDALQHDLVLKTFCKFLRFVHYDVVCVLTIDFLFPRFVGHTRLVRKFWNMNFENTHLSRWVDRFRRPEHDGSTWICKILKIVKRKHEVIRNLIWLYASLRCYYYTKRIKCKKFSNTNRILRSWWFLTWYNWKRKSPDCCLVWIMNHLQ